MKKELSLLLAMLSLTAGTKADDGDVRNTVVDGLEWTYKVLSESDRTCQLGGGNPNLPAVPRSTSGHVTTPQTLDGYAVKAIGQEAFRACYSVSGVHVSDGIEVISAGAFYGCSNLAEITFGNALDSIGSEAFRSCKQLKQLEFPNSLRIIEYYAFYGCERLESVLFGSGIKLIGADAFRGCYNLPEVDFPDGLETIGADAFHRCNLQSVYIPASVRSIGGCAFSSNASLSSIVVDANNLYYDSRNNCNAIISKEDDQLWAGCNNTLIPDDVRIIGVAAFKNCNGLTSVTLPASLKFMDGNAFENCTNLVHVVIPAGLKSFRGGKNFLGCTNLQTVTCYMNSPCAINANGFSDVTFANATLQVRRGCKAKYAATDYWSKFGNIVEIDAPDYMEGDRLVADVDGIAVAYRVVSETEKTCAIGDYTKEDDFSYFLPAVDPGMTGSLCIPESLNGYKVVAVSFAAFYNCALASVTIPPTVAFIDEYAFASCNGLEMVVSNITNPFEINENVFLCYNNGTGIPSFSTATLYVPEGTKRLYESTPAWNRFANIIEDNDTKVVEPQAADAGAAPLQCYSLDGKRRNEPARGVNILRNANGTVRKVMK